MARPKTGARKSSKRFASKSRKSRYRYSKPFRMNISGVHYFERSFVSDITYTTDGSGESSFTANSMALSLLPNVTDFTELFDQYKILGISFNMIYKGGNVQENNVVGVPNEMPIIYTIPDVDDEGTIPFQAGLEHGKMRMHQIQKNGKLYKKFHVPPYVENTVTGLDDLVVYAANPKKSPWLDCGRADLTHGTLKMAISGKPLTDYIFRRVFTVRFLCKNTR